MHFERVQKTRMSTGPEAGAGVGGGGTKPVWRRIIAVRNLHWTRSTTTTPKSVIK
jgi:hypothetical protein